MLACSCLHHAMKRSGAATAALQACCRLRNNAFPGEEVASKLKPDVRLWHVAEVASASLYVRDPRPKVCS